MAAWVADIIAAGLTRENKRAGQTEKWRYELISNYLVRNHLDNQLKNTTGNWHGHFLKELLSIIF